MMITLIALLGILAGGGRPPATGLGADVCATRGPDSDEDELSNACEIYLLGQFAPVLVVSASACNWDPVRGRLAGGYLVGAEPVTGGVRLAYLPAYLDDCGWSGPKCLLRFRGGCEPHRGDSELILIDVAKGGDGDWVALRVFLSAHCFGTSDGRCRWFEAKDLAWLGSAPVVWVAEGKNANYPSRDACDSGHWHYDTCDRNDRAVRFPVLSPTQNIGSAHHPLPDTNGEPGCFDGSELPLSGGLIGTECVWTDQGFGGWSAPGRATATGYGRYLTEIAEFEEPGPRPDRSHSDRHM